MDTRVELAQYLGPNNYESNKLVWLDGADRQWLHYDVDKFQTSKEALYLYTYRENAEWWQPHLAFVRGVKPDGSMLDYHCATGWLGLQYGATAFADYQTRCLTYLKARLKARRQKADVYELGKDDDAIPLFDAVVCFDALWRYEDPLAFIIELTFIAKLVVLDADSRDVEGVADLLKTVRERYEMVSYQNVNHYVHLMAFATGAGIKLED